ncbi:MAG: putative zinc-binding protein [Anaerolineae bacterium]|nr:putative zinc-binding protein [Anaerolineae bacterium]
MSEKVVVIPCSGIGKTFGTVSREAAYAVVEDLRPDRTQLVALSLLVLGDEEARAAVAGHPTITIDGCRLACATKMVQESGLPVARSFTVLDAFRKHRDLKPEGISALNPEGQQLACALAKEIAEAIDALQEEA